jgi:hypothetical protein
MGVFLVCAGLLVAILSFIHVQIMLNDSNRRIAHLPALGHKYRCKDDLIFMCGDVWDQGDLKLHNSCKKRANKFRIVGHRIYCWNDSCDLKLSKDSKHNRWVQAKNIPSEDEKNDSYEDVSEDMARETLILHQVILS